MRNGVLLTDNQEVVRWIGTALAGTNGSVRVRSSVEAFVGEVTSRLIDWVIVDLTHDFSARKLVFHRVPSAVEKHVILDESSDVDRLQLSPLGLSSILHNQVSVSDIRSRLGLTVSERESNGPFSKFALIGSDRPKDLEGLSAEFERMGYQAVFAGNIRELQQTYKRVSPTIVLLAFTHFSSYDFEFCRRVKKTKASERITTILITDEATRELVVEATKAGIDEILRLPLELQSFNERITLAMNRTSTNG
ncbi:MAG: hypothetical protein OEM52_11565 [bacterium]|nr:hypothetical protein [bacterium]